MIVWSIAGLVIFFIAQFLTPTKAITVKQVCCGLISCVLGPLMLIAVVGSYINANIWLKRSATA
ncbi:hypothetical protein [Vibrio taketomensis]|uniref:hypothetical protein n=1 Tax=Vibrio taketomensis TaxID=2572923 RepID=UPI00138962EF|nr:hypothetical protein [Vibrio taketomensis]